MDYNIDAILKLDAEEALRKANELKEITEDTVDLMEEIFPQIAIRGNRDCTFNIYINAKENNNG